MKCEVIRDLLPLYIEKLCSEATKDVVDEHIAGCAACRELLDTLRRQDKAPAQTNGKKINPFKKIKTRNRVVIVASILLTLIVTSALYINFFIVGSAASTDEIAVNAIEMLDEMTFSLNVSSNESHKKIANLGFGQVSNSYFDGEGWVVYVQARLVLAFPFAQGQDYATTFGFDQDALDFGSIKAIYLMGKDKSDLQLLWEAE